MGCGRARAAAGAPRAEDAPRLGGGAVVGDRAERQRAGDGVEALVGKLERLCITEPQVDLAAGVAGAPAGAVEHRCAQLDRGQAHVGGVVGEVAPGAGGHLQHVAAGARAHPFAAPGEQHLFELDPEQYVESRPNAIPIEHGG